MEVVKTTVLSQEVQANPESWSLVQRDTVSSACRYGSGRRKKEQGGEQERKKIMCLLKTKT
jgi:hypothetical protein